MTAYVLALIKVTDKAQFGEYLKRSPAVIAKFGGRYLVRGGEKTTIEGHEFTERLVILAFPDRERALACFESAEYVEARQFRLGAAEMRLVAVDGYEMAI